MAFMAATQAQNFKNIDVKVNILKIPDIIQPAEVNTYSLEINGREGHLNNLGYTQNSILNYMNIRALTKVEGEGENRIVLHFPGYGNMNGTLGTNTTEKDGKVTKTYFYSYTYTLPMSYEIFRGGDRIASGEIKEKKANDYSVSSSVEIFKFSTKSFGTASEAKNNWKTGKGRSDLISQIKGNFDKKLKIFAETVRKKIDYPYTWVYTNFGYFKTTKKADFTIYENAANQAKEALTPLVSGQERTGLAERFSVPMSFWKTTLSKLNPEDKNEDKLFFACANNLANAFYWMDHIDSALYYVEVAKKADFRKGYLSQLEFAITQRKKDLDLLEANGLNPYFGPQPATQEEIDAIFEKAELERMQKEAEMAARLAALERETAPVIEHYDGFIIDRAGKKVEGTFVCYRANTGEKIGKNYFIASGTDNEVELTEAFVTNAEFGNLKYELVKYGDALLRENSLMAILFESDQIKVYRHLTKDKDSERVFSNIYLLKKEEKLATNATGLTFHVAFKKMMANYFEDCPSVSQKALNGDYNGDDNMIVAAAMDYSNCK